MTKNKKSAALKTDTAKKTADKRKTPPVLKSLICGAAGGAALSLPLGFLCVTAGRLATPFIITATLLGMTAAAFTLLFKNRSGPQALLRAAVMFIICLAVFYLMAVTEAYQTVADLFYAGRPGRENSSLGLGSLLYLVAVFWESVLLSAALIIYNLVKWHTNRKNDEKKAYKKQF